MKTLSNFKNIHVSSYLKTYKRKLTTNLNGLVTFFTSEENAGLLTFVTVSNIIIGILLKYDKFQTVTMIFAFVLIWLAELLNTAIERTVDLITLEHKPLAKQAKDIAGAAVILTSINSIVLFVIVNFM